MRAREGCGRGSGTAIERPGRYVLTQAGRGVDMTIRGAVSGRMKRTKAWMVESRASSDCGGELVTWLSGVGGPSRTSQRCRLSAVRASPGVVVAMMSTMVWLSVAEW